MNKIIVAAVFLVVLSFGFLLGVGVTYSRLGGVVTKVATVTQPQLSSASSTTTITTTTLQVTVEGVTTASIQLQDILSVCFSPGGSCADQVVYWIERANNSIHILIYSFTLDIIGNALIKAKQNKPNLDIRIVWDASSSKETGSEYQKLLNAGLQIHIDHRSGLLHDKVAIIDDHIVLTGSFNWSNAANNTNRENLIIINSQTWAAAYEQNFQQNWQATT
jgi:phospholipase D